MKRMLMVLGIIGIVFVTGCAALDKVAPSKVDEAGNQIPGSRELTPFSKDVTDAIPYGGVVASGLLLVINFIEKAKANKTTTGLMATIRAIELAAKDPELKDAIAKLKIQLSEAHQSVNVQPLINRLLAQIKFKI